MTDNVEQLIVHASSGAESIALTLRGFYGSSSIRPFEEYDIVVEPNMIRHKYIARVPTGSPEALILCSCGGFVGRSFTNMHGLQELHGPLARHLVATANSTSDGIPDDLLTAAATYVTRGSLPSIEHFYTILNQCTEYILRKNNFKQLQDDKSRLHQELELVYEKQLETEKLLKSTLEQSKTMEDLLKTKNANMTEKLRKYEQEKHALEIALESATAYFKSSEVTFKQEISHLINQLKTVNNAKAALEDEAAKMEQKLKNTEKELITLKSQQLDLRAELDNIKNQGLWSAIYSYLFGYE
ncbi:hypothetical protein MP638_006514 [Amoeboaphelidium occidentale]|nr:hypothetical protein MP638_006514 [Amoeboaphelidium occidentale]